MCDTVVATREATADGVAVFGKNSDREPNEAHHLLYIPAAEHPAGARVQCTYLDIPQVERTYAVLLAKPFWIWGAEMGANEHGVVIGNEAVFTRVPYEKGRALIGMDLLRLALERAATAREAVTVITDLLAEYGQGGNCGFAHEFYYHNSFLIADPQDAWVLETAGREWAAKQVRGVYAISNGLTLTSEWDLASPGLVDYAVERGWCKGRDDFNFARCYSDHLYTRFSDCASRCARTTELLQAQAGRIDVPAVIAALRDHGRDPAWRPDSGLIGAKVCMHAGFGPVRGHQTTGSMVSHLHPEHPTHFFTATAAPCTSLFKPVWIDAALPDTGPAPAGRYDEASLFWRHEALHRAVLRDFDLRLSTFAEERDELEREFVQQALEMAHCPVEEREAFVQECFERAESAERRWLERVQAQPAGRRLNWLYERAWEGFNRQAGMPG
ncbi:MAG: peptidase U34 [Chloroflexi bacterium]|nr:peptidase U34 [Chloroflexota bacterium]